MKLLPTLCFGVLVEADVGDQLVTYEGRGVAGQEDYRRPGIKKSWSGRGEGLKKNYQCFRSHLSRCLHFETIFLLLRERLQSPNEIRVFSTRLRWQTCDSLEYAGASLSMDPEREWGTFEYFRSNTWPDRAVLWALHKFMFERGFVGRNICLWNSWRLGRHIPCCPTQLQPCTCTLCTWKGTFRQGNSCRFHLCNCNLPQRGHLFSLHPSGCVKK